MNETNTTIGGKMAFFNRIRKSGQTIPLSKAIIHTTIITCLGLIVGVLIKLLDIYTTNLGNIFSQMSVWIFICTLISVYSNSAVRAAVNVFGFCIGMLLTYYITAEMTASVYSPLIAYGWTIFAFLCPLMGFLVWYAKGKRWVSKMISIGIIIVMLVAAVVLFDKIRISDILFAGLTGFILFKR